MLKSKRGQGLPLETIVLAVIAIIILVLIILFLTGNLGKLFGTTQQLGEEITPDEIAAFRLGCEQACFSAKQLVDSEAEFKLSSYCVRNISNTVFCKSPQVGIDCTFEIRQPDGVIVQIDNTKC